MTIHTDYTVVSPYFFIILLSFALSYLFIFLFSKERVENKSHLFYSMLLHFVISMYCGFMFTFVANVINGEPAFLRVGLSGMGGMIGTILSIVVMSFLFKEQKEHYIKCYVMSLPLIYGVSKMGCFLVGCCYGMPYDGPLSVKYYKENVMTPDHSVFPVQLAECIAFVSLAILFYYLVFRKDNSILVWLEIVICCILKFALDYLRNRPNMELSINQKTCILVSIFVLLYIVIMQKKRTSRKRS